MSHVIFNNIYKSYDGKNVVVKGFNMTIEKGEFVTMLGPSGSGKTTCLMMLAGFESVTQGEILVNGAAIDKVPAYKRNIGMVFQNYALFPHMTVGENLAYPLKVRKKPKHEIDSKVKEFLKLVSLDDFADRFPNQLSGGQRQRVAVARSLVFSPEIVLMDEPLGALDKNLREQMQYEIRRLHNQLGFTTLYVTHDQTESLILSDKITVFNDGVAQQIANPKELYEKPNNTFVANFIGENNLIDVKVESIKDKQATVCITGLTENKIKSMLGKNIRNTDSTIDAQLSIRPERINFADKPDVKFDNLINGKIIDIIYSGNEYFYKVEIKDGVVLSITQANQNLDEYYKRHDDCVLGWNIKDCLLLTS